MLMKRTGIISCIALFLFLYTLIGSSTYLYAQQRISVPEDYSSIQTAIYQSNDYDTIIISEGTYFENLLIRDKTLIIGSKYLLTGDTSYISKTIIDGQNNTSIIRIDGDVGEETTISGLTIQNGNDGILTFVKFNLVRNHLRYCQDAVDYENHSGGICSGNLIELNSDDAIDLDSTVNIVIENNVLRNNDDDGIEIRLHEYLGPTANYIIKSNQIYGNGEDGIQIIGDNELTDRILYIENNLITSNRMAGIGSMASMNTIENYEGSDIEERIYVTNNTITKNNHGVTGSNNMIFMNNLVAYNEVVGIKNVDGNSVISHSDFWQNVYDIQNSNFDSTSVIFQDPLIDSTHNLLFGSPCIDAGTSNYIMETDTISIVSRSVLGNEIDMGAYEYDPGQLLKGPYLRYQNMDSQILITWQLRNSDTCTLRWGQNKNDYTYSTVTTENSADSLEHIHSYNFHNLTPGSKYYYVIEENDIKHYGSFRSPPSNTAKITSFYSFGDSRSAVGMFDSISNRVIEEISLDTLSQTFVLHTGDWTNTGSEDDWQEEFFNRWYFNNLKLQSMVSYAGVRGSHENFFNPDASIFSKYFRFTNSDLDNRFYYSFDYGPVHISVIDQFIPYDTTSIQYSWLINDLTETEKQWKIIAFHEPAYSDGVYPNNPDAQDIFRPICNQYNVQLVLAGHNHYYSHNRIDNTHHLTLGGGGAPLVEPAKSSEGLVFSEKTYHFAKIRIEDDEMTVKIIHPDGAVIDTFAIHMYPSSVKYSTDNVHIYPNPTRGAIWIDGLSILSSEKYIVEIRSVSGKVLSKKQVSENKIRIDLSDLPQGMYFCILKKKNVSNTFRIIRI